jgi:hypothetical protein
VGNILAMGKEIRYALRFRPTIPGLLTILTLGDIFYLKVFGQSIVVINSADVAHELFEKRSSIYSDRTELPMIKGLYVGLSPQQIANADLYTEWVGTG